MKKKYSISCGTICEIGDKKPTNQDCIFARHAYINDQTVGLFIVADGVGGLSDGDVISNIIALHFEKWFNRISSGVVPAQNYITEIDKEILTVNKMAYDYAQSVGQKMGSTIALLFTVDDKYYVRNIGDSRIYYLDKSMQFVQLSYDHSFVAELVRTGEITEMEAKVHPKKNMIYSCVAVKPDVEIYSAENYMEHKENIFIVCSDGFYNYAVGEKVMQVLKDKKSSEQEKAENLRKCIPAGNAKDNVSIIFVKVSVKNRLF